MTDTAMPMSNRRRMTIYAAVLAGLFMSVLDMQIIATALPTIAADLGNLELFGWVGAAYLLATAAVTPFYGKLGDLYGRKRLFIAAIVLFTLGSLACGLAWSMESLVAARVLQGIGGGGLMTSAFGILADLFEPRERAKYQGYSSAVFTLAGLVGPVAGGLIAQSVGWQFIFLINLPIGVAVIAVLLFAMPAITHTKRPSVDYLGGMLLAAAVTLTVFWAEEVLGNGTSDVLAIILPVLIVVATAGFIFTERRAAEPMVPLFLFTNHTIGLTLVISVLVGMSSLGMLNYFALFLQTVTGLPPALAGLFFLPSSVGSLLASVGAGLLVARTGRYKIFPVVATALGVVVLLSFAQVDVNTPVWAICILMFFFSVSMGLQMQTLMVAVQNAVPRQDVGAATGALSLSRLIGASLGLAANGGLLTAGLVQAQASLPAATAAQLPVPLRDLTPDAIWSLPPELSHEIVGLFDMAFERIFYMGAGLFAVSLILSLMLRDVRLPGREHVEAVAAPSAAE
ncbi:MDR family MFS transporter [Mariluticola halotolerans]|uniref:MDR family MFS transporter n=1 Tax=Mariluticola halotolerans TaxID=2909283 RepID=UPI0026E29D06|nr:MDR family MFS transporter [Mariluticola halotolerans]UJQ93290.1 MFS transporter [Mariluticola halotolerans]